MKIKVVTTTLALTLALSSTMFFSSSQAAYAQSIPNSSVIDSEVTNELVGQGKLDLNNLDHLPDGVTTRDMSYEEAITSIANLQGITIEEAKRNIPDTTFKLSNNSLSLNAITDKRVKEITIVQNVTNSYKPTLKIYANYYQSGSFRQFIDLLSVQLDASNSAGSIFVGPKTFVGNLEAKLLNISELWWLVNGDFYKDAQTSFSGGFQFGNQYFSGTFSASITSNWYAQHYNTGTYDLY